jgi:cytochrome b6-f complex iron-sulfur subunit
MTEKKKLSTADILAAARKNAAAGAAPASKPADEAPPVEATSEAAEAAAPAESAPVEAAPAAKPKSAVAGGAKLSVAEIMAAARANKAAGAGSAPAKPAAAKPAAEKPAPKPKADKPAAKPAAPVAGAAVRDTSSILAAARGAAKPGPVSKSEAAARLKPSAPAKPAKGETVAPPMPAKPEYAKPKAKDAPQEERRFFLGVLVGSFLGLGFTTLAATGGLWTLAVLRYMFPNVLTEPPSKFKIGFPGDFPPGVVDEKFKAQFGIWPVSVEYKGLRQIVALKTVCTHLGCTPNWLEAEQKFKCPCHGSGFYKDGINFEGPAPRPLERYAIRLADDGQLEVDKSRTFQEELGQWADPACFVSV